MQESEIKVMRIRNKNGLDLWRISDMFLNDENAIVEAASRNVNTNNPAVVEGIRRSVRRAFKQLKTESVKTDNENGEITVRAYS